MRHYTEAISTLHSTALQLAAQPEKLPAYQLRLYSLSLERSALLAQADVEEKYALDTAQAAYEFERERIEEEWKRGRNRIRERMLEGVEDRRRRARDDKDADGVVGGGAFVLKCFTSSTQSSIYHHRDVVGLTIASNCYAKAAQQAGHLAAPHAPIHQR